MVLVFYDLETTGLISKGSFYPSICQIGAMSSTGGVFSGYCQPDQPFHPEASRVTGLHLLDGKLAKDGKLLDTISIESRLQQFMDWIKNLTLNDSDEDGSEEYDSDDEDEDEIEDEDDFNVILIAHKGQKFDHPILRDACAQHDVEIATNVRLFADSLPLLKRVLPKQPLKLTSLVNTFLPDLIFEGHDAVNDARALKEVIDLKVGDETHVRRLLSLI